MAVTVAITTGLRLNSVSAQQDNEVSGQGLEISPPVLSLEADPGDTKVVEVNVRNITDIDVIASGEVNDFTAKDETGDPRILLEEGEESPYPLAEYIQEVPDLEIAPTEQEVVRVPLAVPEDASPGAHLGLIRFSAVPAGGDDDESSQVSLSASIGTLILLNVSGEEEYDLGLEEFSVSQNDQPGEWFETGPFTLVTRLKNEGNVFMQPSGTLRLTNIFGREVGVTRLESEDAEPEDDEGTGEVEFNANERYVLPDSIRRFENAIDKDIWFGRYTATANLSYGPEDEPLEAKTVFWVIPYKLLAVIFVLLLVVGIFGRKALRSYRNHVIRKYQQQDAGKQNQDSEDNPTARPDH